MVARTGESRGALVTASAPALDPFTERRLARERDRRRHTAQLRCVSSGYLSGGCSCIASVPADIAWAAWKEEQRAGVRGGFFQFSWGGETWLGFGVEGKGVRGVYCPAHHAERSERSFVQLLARSAAGSPAPTLTAA